MGDGKNNRKRKGKSHLQGMSEETYCYVPCSYLESFYTKIQYFGPRSDQLFFLHSINSLFGLRGPGSTPVLDSSQVWSLQSLTLQFFFLNFFDFITKGYYNMITIHTHIINPLYFLIIKLYKGILYLYYTHKHQHTSLFTQIILQQKVRHTINIRHTHPLII